MLLTPLTHAAIVNPRSSGKSLIEELASRGVAFTEVWTSENAHHFRAGPSSILVDMNSAARSAEALSSRGATHIIAGSESGVSPAQELAQLLDLPRHVDGLAAARRDKQLMIDVVAAAGIPTAGTTSVRTEDELEVYLATARDRKVIVKPANSSGSDMVSIASTRTEMRAAASAILRATNHMGLQNTSAVIQEFITGPQYLVNTVSRNGTHVMTDLWVDEFTEFEHQPLDLGCTLIVEPTAEEWAAVEYVYSCLTALGIEHGASHSEVRLTPSGPLLIEVNARLMGPVLPPDSMGRPFGYSQVSVLADLIEGDLDTEDFPAYAPTSTLHIEMIRAFRSGRVKSLKGLWKVRRLRSFHSFSGLPGVGTKVEVDNMLTTGALGLGFFVHENATIVQQSVAQFREWSERNQLFDVS